MIRRLLRALVLRTNTWPVLRSLYRLPYRMAETALSRAAAGTPEISALFARGSYASGQWIAGRSDIDLTAVLATPSLSAARRFSARVDQLRHRFPMIGEVEFLDHTCLPAYAAHAFTGFQCSLWLPLTADASSPDHYRHDSAHLHRDRLAYALRVYWLDIPPALFAGAPQTLARLTGKILRTLAIPVPSDLDRLPAPELIGFAFNALAAACAPCTIPELPQSIPSVVRPHTSHTVTSAAPVPADFGTPQRTRIPATASMLFHYLTLSDPAELLLLIQRGELPPVLQPSQNQLRESVHRYAVDIYTYPFREGALSGSPESFRPLLSGWFLWTLRYLQQGDRDYDSAAITTFCLHRHPQLNLSPNTPEERFDLLLAVARRIASLAEPAPLLDPDSPQL